MVNAAGWFGALANAHYDNDFREAAKAETELAKLGVVVKFKRQRLEAAEQ